MFGPATGPRLNLPSLHNLQYENRGIASISMTLMFQSYFIFVSLSRLLARGKVASNSRAPPAARACLPGPHTPAVTAEMRRHCFLVWH